MHDAILTSNSLPGFSGGEEGTDASTAVPLPWVEVAHICIIHSVSRSTMGEGASLYYPSVFPLFWVKVGEGLICIMCVSRAR